MLLAIAQRIRLWFPSFFPVAQVRIPSTQSVLFRDFIDSAFWLLNLSLTCEIEQKIQSKRNLANVSKQFINFCQAHSSTTLSMLYLKG